MTTQPIGDITSELEVLTSYATVIVPSLSVTALSTPIVKSTITDTVADTITVTESTKTIFTQGSSSTFIPAKFLALRDVQHEVRAVKREPATLVTPIPLQTYVPTILSSACSQNVNGTTASTVTTTFVSTVVHTWLDTEPFATYDSTAISVATKTVDEGIYTDTGTAAAVTSDLFETTTATNTNPATATATCEIVVNPNPPTGVPCGEYGRTSESVLSSPAGSSPLDCAMACFDTPQCGYFATGTMSSTQENCVLYAGSTTTTGFIPDSSPDAQKFYSQTCFEYVCPPAAGAAGGVSVASASATATTTQDRNACDPFILLTSPTALVGSTSGARESEDDANYELVLPFQMKIFDHASTNVFVSTNGVSPTPSTVFGPG